jgi:hypothetical protein
MVARHPTFAELRIAEGDISYQDAPYWYRSDQQGPSVDGKRTIDVAHGSTFYSWYTQAYACSYAEDEEGHLLHALMHAWFCMALRLDRQTPDVTVRIRSKPEKAKIGSLVFIAALDVTTLISSASTVSNTRNCVANQLLRRTPLSRSFPPTQRRR